jgi:hypothetical protein
LATAGCSTPGVGESVEAVTSTPAAVKAKLAGKASKDWSAVSTPRFANEITFMADGSFKGAGGCPGDGVGPHCFLIFTLGGTWTATATTLTLRFGGVTPRTETFKWTSGTAELGSFLTLTRKNIDYVFTNHAVGGGGVLPIIPPCQQDADCKGIPINFLCAESVATHSCNPTKHICEPKCVKIRPAPGGGGQPDTTCVGSHVGTASGAGKGSCIDRKLVLEDGCGRGTIDSSASCSENQVCCVSPATKHSASCIFDADCGDPTMFCFRRLTFVNENGNNNSGICLKKARL